MLQTSAVKGLVSLCSRLEKYPWMVSMEHARPSVLENGPLVEHHRQFIDNWKQNVDNDVDSLVSAVYDQYDLAQKELTANIHYIASLTDTAASRVASVYFKDYLFYLIKNKYGLRLTYMYAGYPPRLSSHWLIFDEKTCAEYGYKKGDAFFESLSTERLILRYAARLVTFEKQRIIYLMAGLVNRFLREMAFLMINVNMSSVEPFNDMTIDKCVKNLAIGFAKIKTVDEFEDYSNEDDIIKLSEVNVDTPVNVEEKEKEIQEKKRRGRKPKEELKKEFTGRKFIWNGKPAHLKAFLTMLKDCGFLSEPEGAAKNGSAVIASELFEFRNAEGDATTMQQDLFCSIEKIIKGKGDSAKVFKDALNAIPKLVELK